MGRSLGKPYVSDMDFARKMSIDYTMVAARALTPQDKTAGGKFRFIYVSGIAAVRDQTKSLWFLPEYRRIRVSISSVPWMPYS